MTERVEIKVAPSRHSRLKDMSESLECIATAPRLVFALAALVACSALNFGLGPCGQLATWGGGARLLDMQPASNPEQAQDVLTAFGAEGRALYLRFLAFDTAFLLTHAIAMAMFTAYAFGRLCIRSAWRLLAWLPIAVGALDVIENLGILSLLIGYPYDVLSSGRWLAPITSAKLTLVPLVFALAIGAWAAMGTRSLWRLWTRSLHGGSRRYPEPPPTASARASFK